jgi:lysophospholipase
MKHNKLILLLGIGLLLSLGLQAPSAHAVSETNYSDEMSKYAWPFYGSGQDGSFQGKAGITIKYRKWENPHEIGAIVIFPGRGDPFFDFAETIYDLAHKGYSIYTLDHRGQGSSYRMLANPQLGYVKHFDDYIDDAKTFVDTVVKAVPHKKLFLLGHSMGGAIAATYLHTHPADFDAAVLASPMFEINTAPYTSWEARILVWFELLVHRGKEYGPTQEDFNTNEVFENNRITTSKVRWQTTHDMFLTYPVLQTGGATNRWISESFKASDKIHDFADEIATPVLVISSGDDQLVEEPNIDYFCQHAQHCTQVPAYAGAQHGILWERDPIRDDVFARIFSFYGQFTQ